MPISPFPHLYRATLEGNTLVARSRTPVLVGPPVQLGGGDDSWSGEEMLVAAVLSALKATFDASALRAGITVHGWRGTATGMLVEARTGPCFDSIELDIELVVEPGDEARARTVLENAAQRCTVSRALTAPVRMKCTVESCRAAS